MGSLPELQVSCLGRRFKWDGTHWATAHQHHNGWDEHESGYVPAGDVQEVKIGDRFIEFGKFLGSCRGLDS